MSDSSRSNNNRANDANDDSLAARFEQAVALVHAETSPREAVDHLTALQQEIAMAALFSSNESLDDIATGTLPFLAVEYYMAQALFQIPTGRDDAALRQYHLRRACELCQAFLERLDRLEQLSKEEQGQLLDLMELSSSNSADPEVDVDAQQERMPPPIPRHVKIARFQAQKEATAATAQLHALQERRSRLGVAGTTQLIDGHDDESLARSVAVVTVTQLAKVQAFEAWSSALQELPLVARMVQAQAQQDTQQARYNQSSNHHHHHNSASHVPTSRSSSSNKPLQVTHITQDATTGQLRMERQEIRSNVIRPGWNQPTMTIEELADREVHQAIEREARQKQAESAQLSAPRRYEQLVRHGMEDDADLVDASAVLDRQWDSFKDENPRGSGNKRGDVGDRNF